MSSPLSNDRDIKDFIRLERHMEKTNEHLDSVSQELSVVSQKLVTLGHVEIENNNKMGISY